MRILVTGGFGLVGHAVQDIIANRPNHPAFKELELTPETEPTFATIVLTTIESLLSYISIDAQYPALRHPSAPPGITRTDAAGNQWTFVRQRDGDLRNASAADRIFAGVRPDMVLHLAARVGGLFANSADNVGFFEDNMAMNANVIRLCKKYKVKKCVSCLSTCIFPDQTPYPIDETMLHNGIPHASNLGYSWAKRTVDIMNKVYTTPDTLFTSVIPTNIYGIHDNYDIAGGHVIPGLINKCHRSIATGEPFIVYGSGTPLRQFIYAGDLAELLVWVVNEYQETDSIILSVDPEAEVSIADVARTIAKVMGYTGSIQFDITKSDGQYKKTANNAKLRSYKPDFKFTSLETGLKKTVEGIKSLNLIPLPPLPPITQNYRIA